MMTTLPDGVHIAEVPGGLERLEIDTPLCIAEIFLHGAHVTRWQPRGHEHPVLWMSGRSWFEPGRPIRGGVPICFPWFGPHPSRSDAPAHGIARVQPWALRRVERAADGAIVVELELHANDVSRAVGIGDFSIEFAARFGTTLEMALAVRNPGADAFRFEEALHTYFTVGDAARVEVTGLQGAEYIDKTDGMKRKRQEGTIVFASETDRLYVDTVSTVALVDPVLGRRIVVTKTGSNSTVVWNPWIAKSAAMPDFGDDEWTGMACIETVNAAGNAVTIGPGERHVMTAAVSVAPLAPSR